MEKEVKVDGWMARSGLDDMPEGGEIAGRDVEKTPACLEA